MLFRLLIFAVLAAVVYRAVKNWLGNNEPRGDRRTVQPSDLVDDVMVKDPACGTYFPKRDAVALTMEGQRLHFCSTGCRDRYLAQHSKHDPD